MLWEVTARIPWRVTGATAYTSASDLSEALRRAAAAHGKHGERMGKPSRTGLTSAPGTWYENSPVIVARIESDLPEETVRVKPTAPRTMKAMASIGPRWTEMAKFSSVFLRLALGISFLSAVADRFGLWGAYGHPNVAWGNYARFVDYTARLNWFLPASTILTVANIATAAEIMLGVLLVVGLKTRFAALLSGVLLAIFALAMTIALGIKAPLNFSVFSAAGGALLLGTGTDFPYSLDELLRRKL